MSELSAAQNKFLESALGKLGEPFVEGGRGSRGYDCVGLIVASLKEAGVNVTVPSYSLASKADPMPTVLKHCCETERESLEPGDLIICKRYPITHFLINVDGKRAIHCHPRVGKVAFASLEDPYYKPARCKYYRVKFNGE